MLETGLLFKRLLFLLALIYNFPASSISSFAGNPTIRRKKGVNSQRNKQINLKLTSW
jgi:hypothetical protein